MLKELVRKRLIAAADEIFGLFEKTIALYEEQLCRAREETERHRRQLEDVCKAQIVISFEDVKQLMSHHEELSPQLHGGNANLEQAVPLHHRDEEEHEDVQPLHVKEEEEEKVDIDKFALTAASVESKHEDETPEWSQLHHASPSGPPSGLLAPLSDSDDMEETSRSDADCEDDDRRSKCSEETPKKPFPKRMRCQTEKKSFGCSICDKTFSQESLMMEHKRTHMEEKSFHCSLCGYRFSSVFLLVKHMRTHTGEKPYCCSICGKTLTQKSHLTRHMRIHTGEKPYSCSVCGKAFYRRACLASHMRTHTGEKPFSCSLCGKTFSQNANKITHMKRHETNTV
ncbi:uncharacterized protein LOC144048578 [Vanacampus margaritifer]